jgi:peptide/nickel transport system substrate-binding protein
MSRLRTTGTVAALLVLSAIMPTQAQKTRDTLRVAYADPIATVLQPDDPKPETSLGGYAVFDFVVCYDGTSRSFKPQLAKSWVQVDPRTIDFTLRDDVRFHDGNPLTAEDVAYTLTWLADPKSKLRFAAGQFDWMERAEAIDPQHVRIVAKAATPLAMIQLATSAPIVEAKLHRGNANRSDYGRKTPVGAGPYKAVSVDATGGVTLVKNKAYRSGDPCKQPERSTISRPSRSPTSRPRSPSWRPAASISSRASRRTRPTCWRATRRWRSPPARGSISSI